MRSRSPHQFDHALLRRAKSEMVAAALANGVVPAHNVTLELKDQEFIYNDAAAGADGVRLPAAMEHLPGADRADYARR
ncbi:hypothetical protein O0235_09200 [Tepidiforma flava]|uniref:Uncharacterized protein n=1 Tax=Tepidiforma flava TaxID=3004094 RepID=A0ABY7M2T7_9CHLR|nr:hypothetical protein [Tepidiforma flava]WBL34970.1 hypothetical protein O0235_09200 [Tepidiforma flava]